ncbi:MAG: glycosyltransferase family 2 protein [Lachnospiraceae bacterium]|nr:glycosyltransferase family 2 protein [Lachnospiraceae bacterium]
MEAGNNVYSNLISIIVPIYNGQDYIDRCVRSILAQTYSDWELLLLDGASSDKSPELCNEWQEKDGRIRAILFDKNRGVSEGRNQGLREAKGAYLMFVDVDDWLLPDCLQRLYDDVQKPDVQIAGCSFKKCTDKDWEEQNLNEYKIEASTLNSTTASPLETELSATRLIAGKDFLREGILNHDTRCWSKLYKRQVIEGHFFNEDYTIGEDMLFVWDVTRDAKLISSSQYEGYCYYHNENGAMLKRFRESDIDQIRCWKFLLEQLQEENNKEENEKKEKCDTSVNYSINVIGKTASILLISCMLVAGKLAILPAKERKQYVHIRRQCSNVLKETLNIEGAYEGLDKSYCFKVRFFNRFPDLYLGLYHILKRKR